MRKMLPKLFGSQVLLDENHKAYVADIGLGKILAPCQPADDTWASAATFCWAAPEQLQVIENDIGIVAEFQA